jgi:hypothetical protein
MKKIIGSLAVVALVIAGTSVLRRHQRSSLVSPAERQTLRDAPTGEFSPDARDTVKAAQQLSNSYKDKNKNKDEKLVCDLNIQDGGLGPDKGSIVYHKEIPIFAGVYEFSLVMGKGDGIPVKAEAYVFGGLIGRLTLEARIHDRYVRANWNGGGDGLDIRGVTQPSVEVETEYEIRDKILERPFLTGPRVAPFIVDFDCQLKSTAAQK